jgi:hypothetical protein
MLSPEDLKQIVDAVGQCDWAQWAKAQMQSGLNPTIPGDAQHYGMSLAEVNRTYGGAVDRLPIREITEPMKPNYVGKMGPEASPTAGRGKSQSPDFQPGMKVGPEAQALANLPSGRQLADEIRALLDAVAKENELAARGSGPAYPTLSFDEARQWVHQAYTGGKRHPLHEMRNRELYRLEEHNENIKARLDALESTGDGVLDKARADRVIEYATQHGVDYDTARTACGIH